MGGSMNESMVRFAARPIGFNGNPSELVFQSPVHERVPILHDLFRNVRKYLHKSLITGINFDITCRTIILRLAEQPGNVSLNRTTNIRTRTRTRHIRGWEHHRPSIDVSHLSRQSRYISNPSNHRNIHSLTDEMEQLAFELSVF